METLNNLLSSNDPKVLKTTIKEFYHKIEELEYDLKCEKFSHLSISGSLTKLVKHFEDPLFDNKTWLRFLLTSIYYNYLFKRDDKDYQKGAEYIKSMVDLYP